MEKELIKKLNGAMMGYNPSYFEGGLNDARRELAGIYQLAIEIEVQIHEFRGRLQQMQQFLDVYEKVFNIVDDARKAQEKEETDEADNN